MAFRTNDIALIDGSYPYTKLLSSHLSNSYKLGYREASTFFGIWNSTDPGYTAPAGELGWVLKITPAVSHDTCEADLYSSLTIHQNITNGGSVPWMKININDKRVGIDNISPTYTLDVSGIIHAKGTIMSDGSIKATDTTYGGIYVNNLNVGVPRTSYKTTNYSYRPGIDSGNIFEVSGNLTFYLPGGATDGEDVVIVNTSGGTVTISSSTGTAATILNPANKIKNRWGAAIAYYSTGGAGANAWRLVGDVSI